MNLFDLITLQQKGVLAAHMANYTDAHQAPGGWLTGWSKRKKVTLTGGASGNQNDYQIKLDVVYDSDMQSDFDDIRFTKADGETLIDVWLEIKTDNTAAEIWVKFPTTPVNGVTEDYYMYYGNNDVISVWNGVATFLQYHGATNTDFTDSHILSPIMIYEGKIKVTSINYLAVYGVADTLSSLTNDSITIQSYDVSNLRYLLTENNNTPTNTNESPSLVVDQWYKIKIVNDGVIVHGYVDDNEINSGISTNMPDEDMGLMMWQHTGTSTQEWSFARKYVANPPTYGFGAEESA